MTNDAGVVQGLAHYDAWGVLVSGSAALAPFGFTGELQQGGDVYLRARWYNAARGTFTSRDPWAGDDTTPYSLHPYAYGYANPVSNTDPTGMCPKPPASVGANVICLALFIESAEVPVTGTPFLLHGDGRRFSSNSKPDQSRGYIWINTDTGYAEPHMNPTGYIIVAPVPVCVLPINGDGTVEQPRLEQGSIRGGAGGGSIDYFAPSWYNSWKVTKYQQNRIQVEYDLVLSGYLEDVAPHINGTITFYRNETGGYNAYGERDGYPWAEAYFHHNGVAETIFQRRAVGPDPEDLNAIEGEYRQWLFGIRGGRVGYEIRKQWAKKNPQKDVFGYTRPSGKQ